MQSILSKAKKKTVVFLLPWAATIITNLPYNNRASRFLDRLVWISEGE